MLRDRDGRKHTRMGLAALIRNKPDTESRRLRRLKVFVPVSIIRQTGPVRAHMLDLSNSGARMHTSEPVDSLEKIEIEWEGKLLTGRVAWAKGKRCGVLFDDLLSNNQLVAMIAA